MYSFNNGKFKEAHVWWDTKKDRTADVDVFYFIHDFKKRAEHPFGFRTLQIDLTKTKDEILAGYKGKNRSAIRRSELINYDIKYFSNFDIDIDRYVEVFNSFAEFKKIGKTSKEYLTQLANDGKIIVAESYFEDTLIVCNSYYTDGITTRLLHSFSTMNDKPKDVNTHANRHLTHNTIMHFKDKGYKVFDAGGIGNTEGDNSKFEGIIKFKSGFGGEVVELYKGVTPNGERGKEVMKKYFSEVTK